MLMLKKIPVKDTLTLILLKILYIASNTLNLILLVAF